MDDDDAGPDVDTVVTIDLWPDAFVSFAVFQRCVPYGIGAGMGGIWWGGISAQEVRAAMAVARVPCVDRPAVADDVQDMGGAVAQERNRRADAAAKRAG